MGQGPSGPEGPPGPQGKEGKSNLAWSNLTDAQKAEIVASLAKLPEARGPQGLPGISNPIDVAAILLKNDNLKTEIAKTLSPLPEFNKSVAGAIFADQTHFNRLMSSMYDKIDPTKDKGFIDKLSEYITSSAEYKNRLKGDAGDVGDFSSMKASLITKTLWCADGEICTLPKDYWNTAGTNTAGSVIGIQMNAGTQNLSFGNNTDKDTKGFLTRNPNHGLSHRDFFGKKDDGTPKLPVNGPFLYGEDGGQLGYVQKTGGKNLQDWALQWNTQGNVIVQNELILKGGTSTKNPGKWNTHFAHTPDGKNYIRGDTNILGHVTVEEGETILKGGTSEKNPGKWNTHFAHTPDGKNYIRGDTNMTGHVTIEGDLKVRERNILAEIDQLKTDRDTLFNRTKRFDTNGNSSGFNIGAWNIYDGGGILHFRTSFNPDHRYVMFPGRTTNL